MWVSLVCIYICYNSSPRLDIGSKNKHVHHVSNFTSKTSHLGRAVEILVNETIDTFSFG